jgi:hypothetical protein
MAIYAWFTAQRGDTDKTSAVTDAVAKDKPPE